MTTQDLILDRIYRFNMTNKVGMKLKVTGTYLGDCGRGEIAFSVMYNGHHKVLLAVRPKDIDLIDDVTDSIFSPEN